MTRAERLDIRAQLKVWIESHIEFPEAKVIFRQQFAEVALGMARSKLHASQIAGMHRNTFDRILPEKVKHKARKKPPTPQPQPPQSGTFRESGVTLHEECS